MRKVPDLSLLGVPSPQFRSSPPSASSPSPPVSISISSSYRFLHPFHSITGNPSPDLLVSVP
ncbi:hypothetical protein SLEP1_g4973 [Rubroshorea leprosula]|uniref:Uncharacterized protein n=1 Tax=Rubroshorea leprosula TaxID=152421 RepID=A0AAV5HZ94_9ROSI|nr:hypothetical protein SLEP1_g4973 [Rubroshorea leprosula]